MCPRMAALGTALRAAGLLLICWLCADVISVSDTLPTFGFLLCAGSIFLVVANQ